MSSLRSSTLRASRIYVTCAACCWTKKPDPLARLTQEDAGSTRMAVLSVSRFADLRDELSPNSSRGSGDTALGLVLPVTSRGQSSERDALRFDAEVGLPSVSTTVEGVLTRAPGARDSTTTTTTKPADLPAIAPTPLGAGTSAMLSADRGSADCHVESRNRVPRSLTSGRPLGSTARTTRL